MRTRPWAAALAALWLSAAPGLAALSGTAQALSPSAAAAVSATAVPLSASAAADAPLPALPAHPGPLQRLPNVAWEDFSAVTLVSMPFTAFWALLGALAVGGISQGKFPPELNTPMLAGAGAVAAGASLTIGLVSVHWSSSPGPSPAPKETPTQP